LLEAVETHAVIEQAVDNGVPDVVSVFRSGFDPFDLRAKGLAAGTAGAIFSDCQFEGNDFAISDVAYASRVGILAAS
jgi:hypothetical protein